MKAKFKSTPLGVGTGSSRFSSPQATFSVLYAGKDLATGIAEGMIRDRFMAVTLREVEASELVAWCACEVTATADLMLVDLRDSGPFLLGIDTDVVGARDHAAGQAFSQELHDGFALDGILYRSRMTGADCIAVYDRAIAARLVAPPAVLLPQLDILNGALNQLEIVLR